MSEKHSTQISSDVTYLDYAATTPMDERVALKMAEYLTSVGQFGNAGSPHSFGRAAAQAIDIARRQVADLIQADPSEIIWTSGATEANNLALKGIAALSASRGKHIVTLKTEHPSVLATCQKLEKEGFKITTLTPERNGLVELDAVRLAFRPDTILVSIMHVNNETGIIQDIQRIAELTSEHGILLHVDAAQSAGKMPINIQKTPIDLISFSAHKMYGPKGMGALYVRRKPRIRVAALIHGGGQEQGMRSGTLPVHQIVAMGEAFQIAQHEMSSLTPKMRNLRDQFWQGMASLKTVSVNGDLNFSYPGIINLCFQTMSAHKLMQSLPQLAFSRGSACHAKGEGASLVLRAMGLNEELAQNSVRFSFGRNTTSADIDFAIKKIRETVTAKGNNDS